MPARHFSGAPEVIRTPDLLVRSQTRNSYIIDNYKRTKVLFPPRDCNLALLVDGAIDGAEGVDNLLCHEGR